MSVQMVIMGVVPKSALMKLEHSPVLVMMDTHSMWMEFHVMVRLYI